jgi:hypothetical protein
MRRIVTKTNKEEIEEGKRIGRNAYNVVVEVEALYKTTRGDCGLRAGDVGQL